MPRATRSSSSPRSQQSRRRQLILIRIFHFALPPPNEAPTVQVLINNITAVHPAADPLPAWRLDHRLFRDSSAQASIAQASSAGSVNGVSAVPSRYLQCLSISHHPGMTYLAVSHSLPAPPTSHVASDAGASTPAKAAPSSSQVIAIPAGHDTDELMQIIVARFSPLWTLRQVMQVASGTGFEAGGFRIRFGELKVGSGVRGTVVEVEVEEDEAVDERIQGFWRDLRMDPIKSFGEGDGIQAWLEVLRSR